MESFFSITKSLIIRALIIYFITSLFRKPSAPQTNNTGAPTPTFTAKNIFTDGTPLTLHVYVTENEEMKDFNPTDLFWYKDNLVYGDWASGADKDGTYFLEKNLTITNHIRNNGSLYLHAFVTKRGESPNPKASNFGKNQMTRVVMATGPLVRTKTGLTSWKKI
jgi:hypothetical protein